MTHRAFYEPTLILKIDIREMGGGKAFNDFADHLWIMSELEREKGTGAPFWN